MPAMEAIGRVDGLVIDGRDTLGLATFWAALFDTEIAANENDGHYIDLAPNDRMPLLRFQRVPETKSIKNRLHLDVEVEDLDGSVARVEELGGSVVSPARVEYGWRFVIVGDPEGNEFCLIRRDER